MIKLVDTINQVGEYPLYLPNSISVTDGEITICDGGNSRICKINGGVEECFGAFGIGKYKFKEPVFSINYENSTYVCDWHNHRIVQYIDGVFTSQIGIYGAKQDSKIKNIKRFIRSLSSHGSFIVEHFGDREEIRNTSSKLKSLINICKGLIYYCSHPIYLLHSINHNIFINKPNGCVLINDTLFFTQKNNKCISAYSLSKNTIIKDVYKYTNNKYFGRLGQISVYQDNLYVCDETNNMIHIFTEGLESIKSISITNYNVFSFAMNNKYIVTCGERSYSVFDHYYNLLYQKTGGGEFHGVSLDNNQLYICNRLKNRVEVYSLPDDFK